MTPGGRWRRGARGWRSPPASPGPSSWSRRSRTALPRTWSPPPTRPAWARCRRRASSTPPPSSPTTGWRSPSPPATPRGSRGLPTSPVTISSWCLRTRRCRPGSSRRRRCRRPASPSPRNRWSSTPRRRERSRSTSCSPTSAPSRNVAFGAAFAGGGAPAGAGEGGGLAGARRPVGPRREEATRPLGRPGPAGGGGASAGHRAPRPAPRRAAGRSRRDRAGGASTGTPGPAFRLQGVRLLVTHDPLEAMALADRLVVIESGRLVQERPIAEVTARPRSAWVAAMVGLNLFLRRPAHATSGARLRAHPDRRRGHPGRGRRSGARHRRRGLGVGEGDGGLRPPRMSIVSGSQPGRRSRR